MARFAGPFLLLASTLGAEPLDLSKGRIPFVPSLSALFQVSQPVSGIQYTAPGGTFSGGTITTPILAANGSAGAPSYSFTSSTSSGMLWNGNVVLDNANTNFLSLSTTQIIAGLNGSAGTPALANANFLTTGLYWAAGPTLNVSVGGSANSVWTGANSFIFGAAQDCGTNSAGNFGCGNSQQIGFSSSGNLSSASTFDTILTRAAAATLQLGAADAAAPVAQTLQPQNVVAGTSNVAGPKLSIPSAKGTGNGAGSEIALQRSLMLGTGTTQQSSQDAIVACESKTLSNTSATTTALANIASPSNSSGGAFFTLSVQCTDGTNFDSDNITCSTSWVNKAGTFTVTVPVCTATTAANNSGSCTIAPTVTGAGSTISINVTPVITTIAPTTTTGFIEVLNHGGGNVTCQ